MLMLMEPTQPPQSPVNPSPAPTPLPPPPDPRVTPVQPIVPGPAAQAYAVQQQPVSPAVPLKPAVNAGIIVLQWLTYAFWGWTVLALSFLTSSVIENVINGSDSNGFVPYGVAAILVLLPIAFICDSLYSKHENQHKSGAEMLVMVIHAVIFALLGIGSLIAAVFSITQMVVSSSDLKSYIATLISALIIFILYGLTFLRTLHPKGIDRFCRFYRLLMAVLVGIIALLGVIGPMAQARTSRNDTLIEDNISSLQDSIENYYKTNKQMPKTLAEINATGDLQKMIDTKLVTYTPGSEIVTTTALDNTGINGVSSSSSSTAFRTNYPAEPVAYSYQLCATFKKASPDYSKYSSSLSATDENGYTEYLSASSHPAGKVCYKLKTGQNY